MYFCNFWDHVPLLFECSRSTILNKQLQQYVYIVQKLHTQEQLVHWATTDTLISDPFYFPSAIKKTKNKPCVTVWFPQRDLAK